MGRATREMMGLTALLSGLLVWSYRQIIAPDWAYLGCPLGPWDPVGTSLGIGLAVAASSLLPATMQRLTDWWRLSTFAIVLVPAAVLPWQTGWWSLETGLVALAGLGGAWALFHLVPTMPRAMTPGLPSRVPLGLLLFGGAAAAALLLVAALGVPQKLPGLFSVYGHRAAVRAAVQGNGLLGYLLPWALNVLAPGVLAWGLWYRQRVVALAGAAFVLALYAWSGQKSALLPLFLLPLVLGWGHLRQWRTRTLLMGLIAMVVVAIGVDVFVFDRSLASSLLVRRALVIPGLLFAQYGQFFADHGYTFWSDSILRVVESYPYYQPRQSLVGGAWVPQTKGAMWANGSWWSDALSHGGLLALWAMGLIGGLCRALMDWSLARRAEGIVLGVLLIPLLLLTNSGFFVTLLTHGLLVGWAFAFMAPRASTPQVSHAHL